MAPMKIYLVGGAVRDRLLQRPPGDRDWVVVGANAGTKAAKAEELGLAVLDEAAFRRLLETGSPD